MFQSSFIRSRFALIPVNKTIKSISVVATRGRHLSFLRLFLERTWTQCARCGQPCCIRTSFCLNCSIQSDCSELEQRNLTKEIFFIRLGPQDLILWAKTEVWIGIFFRCNQTLFWTSNIGYQHFKNSNSSCQKNFYWKNVFVVFLQVDGQGLRDKKYCYY